MILTSSIKMEKKIKKKGYIVLTHELAEATIVISALDPSAKNLRGFLRFTTKNITGTTKHPSRTFPITSARTK